MQYPNISPKPAAQIPLERILSGAVTQAAAHEQGVSEELRTAEINGEVKSSSSAKGSTYRFGFLRFVHIGPWSFPGIGHWPAARAHDKDGGCADGNPDPLQKGPGALP